MYGCMYDVSMCYIGMSDLYMMYVCVCEACVLNVRMHILYDWRKDALVDRMMD